MPPTPTPFSPPATREELLRRGRSVIRLSDKVLEELAAAWGVGAADESDSCIGDDELPTKLFTSPTTTPRVFKVHDKDGNRWLTVDTHGNLDLLHGMMRAWSERRRHLDEPLPAVGPLVIEPFNHNYRIVDAATRKTVALVSYGGEDIMGEAVAAFNRAKEHIRTRFSSCGDYWRVQFYLHGQRDGRNPLSTVVRAINGVEAVKEVRRLYGRIEFDEVEKAERSW